MPVLTMGSHPKQMPAPGNWACQLLETSAPYQSTARSSGVFVIAEIAMQQVAE